MTSGPTRESGQAAPIYIAMVVGLLFLALAFFAVGQAGATRNGAQSGADAAALAAALESRDDFGDELLKRILAPGFDPDSLRDLLGGKLVGAPGEGCAAAESLAQTNGTTTSRPPGSCVPLGDGRWGFAVGVVTLDPVGDTILPGTESEHASATATAVVEFRCTFEPADVSLPSPGPESPTPTPTPAPTPSEPEKPDSWGTFHCDGGDDFILDPQDPDPLPDLSDLFTVRLDGD
ncbi:pilus assembly protein TadG-related protein [Streptomyces sp. CAU 1734]|uniref:pilus assembly protein TadG-related protein n=1 Tax=Streptomyces sp. CAU 1734 TaxID=3140360 RepID=UPI003260A221